MVVVLIVALDIAFWSVDPLLEVFPESPNLIPESVPKKCPFESQHVFAKIDTIIFFFFFFFLLKKIKVHMMMEQTLLSTR